MTSNAYEIRICQNCGLRYPLVEAHPFGEKCPQCGNQTSSILRRELVTEPVKEIHPLRIPNLETLLDNIRSAWNVGSMFRTAEGFGIHKLHLCGITPTPEFAGVGKTALGAELTVPWTYYPNAVIAAHGLKTEGKQLWSLEHDERAVRFDDPVLIESIEKTEDIVLIAGNEITGVDPEILELSDQIIYIPMLGSKRSLNVAVAYGIAIHALRSIQSPSRQNNGVFHR